MRSDEGESSCFGDNSTLRYQTRVTGMMNMPARRVLLSDVFMG